jgi:phage tail-like protein
MQGDDYPPAAFAFKVAFIGSEDISDTSFQDVSGIKATIETETYKELGENGFEYQLPKPATYTNLVLKRGVASTNSPLVLWCKSIFENELSIFEPMEIMVSLIDENKEPKRAWSFSNAFPVSWEVEAFNSSKNEVAIEKIELSYNFLTRVL